jgi:hypothetical protein
VTGDGRLNASLPPLLSHSTSSHLGVSARARLRPERFGAYPPHPGHRARHAADEQWHAARRAPPCARAMLVC